MFRARCSTRASNASIAMTRIPFGSTRRGTNCACAATRQRPKIRPFTILPPITFINPEAKELSAWNVICRRKPTWGLMPGGITVSGFLDLIFRSSSGCPMPVIVATKTKTRSGLQMRSLPERVPVAPRKFATPKPFMLFAPESQMPRNFCSKQPVTRRLRPLLGRELCLLSGDF